MGDNCVWLRTTDTLNCLLGPKRRKCKKLCSSLIDSNFRQGTKVNSIRSKGTSNGTYNGTFKGSVLNSSHAIEMSELKGSG
jgi:hypothetical protein